MFRDTKSDNMRYYVILDEIKRSEEKLKCYDFKGLVISPDTKRENMRFPVTFRKSTALFFTEVWQQTPFPPKGCEIKSI